MEESMALVMHMNDDWPRDLMTAIVFIECVSSQLQRVGSLDACRASKLQNHRSLNSLSTYTYDRYTLILEVVLEVSGESVLVGLKESGLVLGLGISIVVLGVGSIILRCIDKRSTLLFRDGHGDHRGGSVAREDTYKVM
jgi:hypothetical protein